MSTKALKRELLAAVVMLLVAAIALSGSTFAWFANNNKVDATGMEFRAQTSATLAISEDGTKYGTTMELATTTGAFYPVTLVDESSTGPVKALGTVVTENASASYTVVNDLAFYNLTEKNTVKDPSKFNAEKLMSTSITAGDVDTYFTKNTVDFITDDLWVKYVGSDATATVNLDIELIDSATTAALAINKAFHVALVNTATNEIWNYDVPAGTAKDISDPADGTNDVCSYAISVPSFVVLNNNEPVQYTVYVWLEGEDTDCTTDNAVLANTLSMNLTFTKQ